MIDRIVDRLAERGWAVMPDFLPASLAATLSAEVDALHREGSLNPAATGQGQYRDIHREIRGDGIFWLDALAPTPAQRDYFARMETLRLAANRALQLGLFDLEAHFARYEAGAYYKKHVDVFRHDDRRALSVICYLNADWQACDGGQLRLYPESGETVEVLPQSGTLACFLSAGFLHEVLPAKRPRFSLTGWFRRR